MAVTIPKNDHRAVWLLLTSLALVLLGYAVFPTAERAVDYSLGYLLSLLITLVPIGIVCWAVWRGAYGVKLLVIGMSLYEFVKPLFHFSRLQIPPFTPQFIVLTVSLIPWMAAVIILARDLLRRPSATS
ncbi:hypothetical protein [Hymenobacter pini]|uniref:hypothetical protein n=1 Tax=Hymenobacter pini TaxID=2880879 RepID=UPI001CF350FE|nr:hypothetical protein [Hymenobacter pini]MCA8830148.1 hypothetical protein [Hymenobacter pini]